MTTGTPSPASLLRGGAPIALALAAVTMALTLLDPRAASPLRHAYLVVVVTAGLRGGAVAGAAAGLSAVLLDAPFVLPEIEREGLTAAAGEGLVTLAVLLAAGPLSGRLAAHAARQRRRSETLLAVQPALDADVPLDALLLRLHAALASRLDADAIVLALRDGDRLLVAGGADVAPGSPVAGVLADGEPRFVPDVAATGAPRRLLVVPVGAGAHRAGALAIARDGDIPGEERGALLALGVHVGLALENARLAARQRRFAAELEEKVRAATQRLVEMDRMKSDFVAIASHELRTPLTALQGFGELLAARRFSPDEVRRVAAIIRVETERLGRIVSDFLDLARLERGLTPVLRRVPVVVEPALRAAVELFERARATHRFALRCVEPLPALDADPDALDRVVKNLVSNAVKYSPPGSCVHVEACAEPDGDGVVLTVADEGAGIPADEAEKIFEPYYRTASAGSTARGTGLGLAVVRSLVEAHGGTIRAAPGPCGGTRMVVVWPRVP